MKSSPDESPPGAFVPPHTWIDEFDSQCTELLLKRARRFAASRPGNDAYDADELVQSIVTDTLLGVLHWDPAVRPLEMHLFDAVRQRSKREVIRAKRFPHASVDAVDAAGESRVLAEAEAQLLAEAPESTPETVARAAEIMVTLNMLASSKPLLLRLLEAFASGASSKDDVIRLANLTEAEYHNARRQLSRLVDQLPDHLRPRGT